jgi:predicted O-methyltransferase YrrM
MSSDEHRLLVNILRGSKSKGKHLEIGTGAGGTLCVMLKAFPKDNLPSFVVVDTMRYFPDQLASVKRNLMRNGFDENAVDIRVAKSDCAFIQAAASQEKFDFILIDGSHKVRAVMNDLRWSRLVNVGGLICLHDYSSRFLGVKYAVNHFLRRNRNYHITAQSDSLLVLQKITESVRLEVTHLDEIYALVLHLPLKLIANWQRKYRA